MRGLLCLPPFIPVYLCANVGPRGATRHSACPILRHSESGPLGLSVHECGTAGSANGQTACPVCPTLRQSQSRHGNESPLHPVSAPPTGLDECLFCISLVLDPLAVRFSVSSGCARRRLPTPPSWFSVCPLLFGKDLSNKANVPIFCYTTPQPYTPPQSLYYSYAGLLPLAKHSAPQILRVCSSF